MNNILVGVEGHQLVTYKMNHEALHGSRNQHVGSASYHRLMVCMVVPVASSLYYVT
jgi:hypothetical protein